MAIKVPIVLKSSDVEYTRMDTSAGVRRQCPWQLKLLLVLSVVLFLSWMLYSQYGEHLSRFALSQNGDNEGLPVEGLSDPFTYGKSSSDFYDLTPTNKMLYAANNATRSEAKADGESGHGKKFITECKLPKLNPWGSAILYYLDPTYYMNWKRDCKRTIPELTKLVNGYVVMDSEAKNNGTVCEFRCLYPKNDFEYLEGQWTALSYEPDCDVVETRCCHEKLENNAFYYNYLHVQVYRKLEWKEPRKVKPQTSTQMPEVIEVHQTPDFDAKRRAPDVHLIILDSVSHTQFLRTMTKTTTWLRERMEAVAFPHLNKIGLNSRPNGYGLLLGIQAYPVENSPMGEGYKPPRDLDTMGGIYLDHEPFVGFEFRQKNYRTMMAEDWGKGVFNWPRNYGFDKQPTEHYMRPFHLRTETPYDVDKQMTWAVHSGSCLEPHHYIMNYLKEFVDVYEEQPKFSVSWMSEIAHYSVNGPYRMDEEVYSFLRDYEQKLNNSFVIIMGDHGLRFGGVRSTKQGEVEDNNPALFMALPEHLRYNKELVQNMRDNARQLITHFDIHATMVTIARQGAAMNERTPFAKIAPEIKAATPLGQSLFYPLDKTVPRNCATLRIPFEFCQCQFEKRTVTQTEVELGKQMAGVVIDRMNKDLAKKQVDDKCASLALGSVPVEVLEFEPDKHVDVFQVTFETVPGNGRFWAYVQVANRGQGNQSYSLISTRFPRLNEYATQSSCIDVYSVAPYCYCKNLLKETTAAPTTSTKDNETQTAADSNLVLTP